MTQKTDAGHVDLSGDNLLREQVAACTLLLNDLKIMAYSGHVSARLPGRDAYLIQPFDQPRSGLRPEHLLICDYDGNVLSGPAGVRAPAEVYLHGEILRARPDINSVAHFHHDITNVFTLVEDMPLLPLKNHAIRWVSGMPVHDDPSHVANSELGRAVAKTLGPHHAMQIRAHGQIVTAESVPAVLVDSVHFVENGEAMYHAAAIGKVVPLTERDIAAFARDFKRVPHVAKLWKYYVEGGRTSGLIPKDWALD
ncbi:MAG: ribulose-5-phosphate 4-epimerase-like epimerase or aldolase [Hyphomicrobiales bacterium]|nr:ribulose-5-phosphate 4-epimerase-like epimerase or aldolase [Hyphomicrobiales bacterium]